MDMYVVIVFGVLGLLMKRFEYEPAPLVLAFVLGPLLETALRRSLILSDGSMAIFVARPIAAAVMALAAVFLLIPFFVRSRIAKGMSADE
jgi:putative tricarboxylic transport membrane protein